VGVGRRSCSAVGPLRCPDLVAAQVKPDGPPTFREIALDLHLVRPHDLITRDTDSAPAGAEPRHSAILLREIAGEDFPADAASVVVQFAQSASPQEVGGVLPGRSSTRAPQEHGSQTRSSSFGPSSMSHRACFSRPFHVSFLTTVSPIWTESPSATTSGQISHVGQGVRFSGAPGSLDARGTTSERAVRAMVGSSSSGEPRVRVRPRRPQAASAWPALAPRPAPCRGSRPSR